MNRKEFAILLLLVYSLISVAQPCKAADASFAHNESDYGYFKGDMVLFKGDSLYNGVVKLSDFTTFRGFFRNGFHIVSAYITNALGTTRVMTYTRDDYMWVKDEFDDAYMHTYFCGDVYSASLTYDAKKDRWESAYTIDGESTYPIIWDDERILISSDEKDDVIFDSCMAFLLVAFLLAVLLHPLSKIMSENYRWLFYLIIYIALPLISLCVWSRHELHYLVPIYYLLMIFCLFYYLFAGFTEKRRIVTYTIVSGSIFLSVLSFQILVQESSVVMRDGTTVSVRWKPGTDPVKRIFLKSQLKNFIPMTISDEDSEYTVYVSEHPMNSAFTLVMADQYGSMLEMLMRRKSPETSLHYRAVKVLLRYIKGTTDLDFDLLSLDEYRKLSICNEDDDSYEMTSSYAPSVTMVNYDADRLVDIYDHVYQYYNDGVRTRSCKVIKDDSFASAAPFRLVLRPDGAGRISYSIIGEKHSDCTDEELPNKIVLVEFNGMDVSHDVDVEYFQELYMKSRYVGKHIKAKDENGDMVEFSDLPGGDSYDYLITDINENK